MSGDHYENFSGDMGQPWYGPLDECAELALRDVTELLRYVTERAQGATPVNNEFGPEWDINPNPSITPDGTYVAGNAKLLDNEQVKFCVPVLDQGHVEFPGTPEGLEMLRAVLLRAVADAPPGDVQIIISDLWHNKPLAAFANLGNDLFRYVPGGKVKALLEQLGDDAARIQNRILLGRTSLREMVETDPNLMDAERRPEPWRLVVLLGDGRTQPDLRALQEVGPDVGIHFLTWNVPLERDEYGKSPNFTHIGAEYLVGVDPGVSPRPNLIAKITDKIGKLARAPLKPPNPDMVNPKELWKEKATQGLSVIVGLSGGETKVFGLDDTTPHWAIEGPTGSGKTTLMRKIISSLAQHYDPNELSITMLDFKGVEPAIWGPSKDDPTYLPHCRLIASNVGADHELGIDVLRRLDQEMENRGDAFRKAGVAKYGEYRDAGGQMPQEVLVIDEVHELWNGPNGSEAIDLMEKIARKGRSFGIHLIVGSQKLKDYNIRTHGSLDALLKQFTMRVAMPQAPNVLEVDNAAASNIKKGSAIFNPASGYKGPGGENNNEVRFSDYDIPAVRKAKQRIKGRGDKLPEHLRRPVIYDGAAKPPLKDVLVQKPTEHSNAVPEMVIGQKINLESSGESVTFGDQAGANFAVFGRNNGTPYDVAETAALSLSRQIKPATFRVVCSTNDPAAARRAEVLRERLKANGHNVHSYGMTESSAAVEDVAGTLGSNQREYLILLGTDGLAIGDRNTKGKLKKILTEGPQQGVHAIVATGSPDDLTAAFDGMSSDVPKAFKAWAAAPGVNNSELSRLLPREPRWEQQKDRVRFYDKTSGQEPAKLRVYDTTEV